MEIQNQQENLIVSPTPKISPIVDYKLRTVTVRIKDTLEPNTTYSINFGNSIRDINESNILKDFTYVFSTGSSLDDKQLSGKIILAETGKIDSTLTVMLHRNAEDSAVIKERPRYIAKLNGTGDFIFRNLPSATFNLYALKDEGGTLKYLAKSQLFAFAPNPVAINDTTQPVTLYVYAESAEEPKRPLIATPSAKEKISTEKRLTFQTNLENGQQDLLSDFDFQFPTPLRIFDSSKIQFTDIIYQPLQNYSFAADSLNKKFTLKFAWIPDSTYHLILNKDFAEDSTGRKLLKTDTITFKAKKETDYGSLRLRFPALDLSKNPVLQLVQSDKIAYSHVFINNEFLIRRFKPGDYEIRILYDENRNGKWDAGEFFGKHLQPEKVQFIDRKLTVKGNWDNDVSVEL